MWSKVCNFLCVYIYIICKINVSMLTSAIVFIVKALQVEFKIIQWHRRWSIFLSSLYVWKISKGHKIKHLLSILSFWKIRSKPAEITIIFYYKNINRWLMIIPSWASMQFQVVKIMQFIKKKKFKKKKNFMCMWFNLCTTEN